jgi:hypothetical protein
MKLQATSRHTLILLTRRQAADKAYYYGKSPFTTDNDINFIPQSFGFATPVFKATEAIECAHTEACGTSR